MENINEFNEIADAENKEFNLLWNYFETVLNDQFVSSATLNGIKMWEKMLQIKTKYSENEDVRKFRILVRLNEQLPYTFRMLNEQLKTLCGEEGYVAEIDNGKYLLVVRVRLSVEKKMIEVEELLKRMVPANMLIDLSLMYNQHSKLEKYTHKQLKEYTHDGLRKEAI